MSSQRKSGMIGTTRQIKKAGHEECGFPIPLCRRENLLHNSICCTLVPIIPNSSVVCNRAKRFSNWQKGLCVCKYMRCGIIPAPLSCLSRRETPERAGDGPVRSWGDPARIYNPSLSALQRPRLPDKGSPCFNCAQRRGHKRGDPMDRNLTIELTPYQTDRLLNILTSWAIYCEHDAASLLQMKGDRKSVV